MVMFSNNNAVEGGAMTFVRNSNITLKGNALVMFVNNSVTTSGGALSTDGDVMIEESSTLLLMITMLKVMVEQ